MAPGAGGAHEGEYSLALLVLGLQAGAPRDAADSPAEGRASATEMYFRGCRSLSRSATKHV